MAISWYSYKVCGQDYHEISVKEISHGMKKRRLSEITMRKRGEKRYHGTDIKVNFEEYHEMTEKVFYHGNNKEVVVKKYHEETNKVFCHGKGNYGHKQVYHEKEKKIGFHGKVEKAYLECAMRACERWNFMVKEKR